jgi:hypothetical protein
MIMMMMIIMTAGFCMMMMMIIIIITTYSALQHVHIPSQSKFSRQYGPVLPL